MRHVHTNRRQLATVCALAASIVSAAHAQTPADANKPPNSNFATGPSQQVAEPRLGPLFGPIFGPDHLFGDWGGARTFLHDRGIDVALDYITENAGNITGGRQQAFRTAGQVGLEIDLDLGKLAGLPNNAFHTMMVNGEGRSLGADALGDDLETPQEIYGGRGNVIDHLVYAYDEQTLLDNRLDLVGGWLPVGTYFASSPINCDFMNVTTCGNPHPLPNYPGEEDWPQADFGVQARYLLARRFYVMAGLYQVDIDFGTSGGGISGWAWADPHKSGVSIPVEAGWVPQFGPDNLIGHYKVGVDVDTHRYANVSGGAGTPHGRQAEYILVDQMLVRQGHGDTAGVIAFGGIVHETASVSPLEAQAFGGMVATGAPWGRPEDTLA